MATKKAVPAKTARPKKPKKQEFLQEAADLNEVNERIYSQTIRVEAAESALRDEQEKLYALYSERSAVNAAFLRAVRDRAE